MKATADMVEEFAGLRQRYQKANRRMEMLQDSAVEGMRKIGVGCVTDKNKQEFLSLKNELESVMSRMKEICSSLD